MIRRLRSRHRWMIVIVAAACLAIGAVALLGHTAARRISIPASLEGTSP